MICLIVGLANLDVTYDMDRMRKRPSSFIIDITANDTECTTSFLGARNTQLLRGCVFQVLLLTYVVWETINSFVCPSRTFLNFQRSFLDDG